MPTNNSWNNNVAAANVSFTGGTMGIGTDPTTNAINIGTGAAARTTTIGSVAGATAVKINTGTEGFSISSGTNSLMIAHSTGQINFPSQSAFLVTSSGATLVTGNGTLYTVKFDTSIFDIESNFNTGTYTFTAPIAGKYKFDVTLGFTGVLSTHTVQLFSLITTLATYQWYGSPAKACDNNGQYNTAISVLAPMNFNDTAYVQINIYNGTKVIDLNSSTLWTRFSGNLVC
jgi:hypothetical protein